MKPTTPIVLLFVVLLFALLWLGILAQKADAPELLPVDTAGQTGTHSEQQNSEPVYEESENLEFGNDAGMELPIPDDGFLEEYEESSSTVDSLEVI